MHDIYIVNHMAKNISFFRSLSVDKKYVICTSGPMDATVIARKVSTDSEVETIYAVGGDGTVNEVANGMYDSSKRLGIIPCGMNNNIYCSTLKADEIDVGKVNDRLFLGSAIIGFLDDYEYRTSYLQNVQRYYQNLKPFSTIKNDEQKCRIKELLFLAICNCRFLNNTVSFNKSAQVDDGLFELYTIEEMKYFHLFTALLKLLAGFSSKKISKLEIDKYYLELLGMVSCSIDGEIISINKLNFKVMEKKIKLSHFNV